MNAWRRLAWAGVWGFVTVLAIGVQPPSAAQKQDQQGQQAPQTTNNSGIPSNNGFAIESEMLTYSAMDADSRAMACNVAQNLGAADDKCAPKGMANAPGVVIVAGDSSALTEFQMWRSDISTMDILTRRANQYCPQQGQRGLISTLESALSGFPVGQALSVAKSLFTTTSVTTLLGGNILDQTLMNDVAGHLRTAGVQVVVPDTYMPQSLVTINETKSPFLSKFLALMNARGCVEVRPGDEATQAAKPAAGAAQANHQDQAAADQDKRAIAVAIDAYLDTLTAPVTTVPAAMATTPPEEREREAMLAPQGQSLSHLNAVMRADGLAQEMGFDTSNPSAGANSPWTVLWVKALESGGDEVASDNMIKGSKTNYTGGAVGTYALFRLNGEIACSGAVFDLAGPVLLADIPKFVDGSSTAPAARLVGGCK